MATGNAVLRAYSKAAKRLDNECLASASESAGYIIPKGTKRGWQVFVKIVKWDENLLKIDPLTGGCYVQP